MATYSIRDLENISGIKAHTLRMWEQRFEILRPKRTDTNIRFYDDCDLRLLLSISMLNGHGVKISQIAKMAPEAIHDACGSLSQVSDDVAMQVQTLTLAMIELDEERFEKVIASSTLKYGFEETMLRIVHPFFERVGILWQTGAVRPAQEHFISNLMRQKLIVAIDAQVPVRGEGMPKYLLYLPEYEMHELGLLFACYLLRARHNKVIYLGQSVPDDDLESIYQTYKPDCFLTILTTTPPKDTVQEYLDRLSSRFPQAKFLVSGNAAKCAKPTCPNVRLLPTVQALLEHLQSA